MITKTSKISCPHCDRVCTGGTGMGQHLRKAHPDMKTRFKRGAFIHVESNGHQSGPIEPLQSDTRSPFSREVVSVATLIDTAMQKTRMEIAFAQSKLKALESLLGDFTSGNS